MIGQRVNQFVLVICLLWTAQLGAQPPRDGRDKFFDAMGEAHRQLTPDRELFELLWYESVQKAIGLSPENFEKIEELRRDGFRAVMSLREELKDKPFGKEEILEKILATQEPVEKQIFELLHTSEYANFERLLGIYVQTRGYRAATNKYVAERIGLAGDAFAGYRQSRSEIWHQLMEENRDKVGNLIREGDRRKIARLFEEAEMNLNVALAAKLTAEQRSKLQALEGEKFELPKQPFDFRGPPRGRRGDAERRAPTQNEKESCCRAADELLVESASRS